MTQLSLAAATCLYAVASVLLMLFGINLLRMALVVTRGGSRRAHSPSPTGPPIDAPMVTVQLPIYNEVYVATRAIEAACALDYPRHRLEIQVLDDSTDETTSVIADAVAAGRALGVDITHVRRNDRAGYKAGALANGLAMASGELIAIFDADFVPGPDVLRLLVPDFIEPDVGFVQARWAHLNADHSTLTQLQALAIDAHFMVEQSARGSRGHWFNFNGTCGVWRREAIEDAGGWTADTLTEDLDLSYRAHLAGWRGVFRGDVAVPGEVPAQMSGFRRQQHRWARGSLECAHKLLGRVWRADVRAGVKVQATAHLCAYGVHLLLLALTLLYPAVVAFGADHDEVRRLYGLAAPLALVSAAPAVFLLVGQRELGRRWWRTIPRVGTLVVVGSGLMVNTARAAIDIWRRPNAGFERTAKFGLDDSADAHWAAKRYQLRLDPIVYVEAGVAVYTFWSAWFAIRHQSWGIATYATVFGVGLCAVVAMTLQQHVAVRRHRPAGRASVSTESATAASGTP